VLGSCARLVALTSAAHAGVVTQRGAMSASFEPTDVADRP
jgi:hypothetical protein